MAVRITEKCRLGIQNTLEKEIKEEAAFAFTAKK
jgi:hypothetical protein